MRKIKTAVNASELWTIYGSFGQVKGAFNGDENSFCAENGEYQVSSVRVKDENGVVTQNGKIRNISDHTININYLTSKFIFDGGEYEVYTQANSWQNESLGSWQKLVTSVSAESRSVRSTFGAVPFFALWNEQTQRGTAFHVITEKAWKFLISRLPRFGGEVNYIDVEVGINNVNFSVDLKSGEEMELPEVIFYEFTNKVDMDCYKFHNYMNRRFPRRDVPVIYNTWLYKFEKITLENVTSQIAAAKDLGVDYFVIDAGWFGHGDFWASRGDWVEREDEVFCGRMKELADNVRANGMKFGFWLEIESAGEEAKILKEHSDYYFDYDGMILFDFANPEACEYMYRTVSGLVEKYDVKFFKFDYNQDTLLDVHHSAYGEYQKGYRGLMTRLRKAYPDLYIECCAGGGLRLGLDNYQDFDSYWISDDQSPYEGMRIFKDSIRRMPPQSLEKWASIQSVENFGHVYLDNPTEKIISSNDATWNDVRGVHPSYLEGFLTGGPIGLSCDLLSFSPALTEQLKKHIAQFKKEKEFWKNAVARILTDTESMLVLQYSDMELNEIKILAYSNRIRQNNISIYPVLNANEKYCLNGKEILEGRELAEEGIDLALEGNFKMIRMDLKKVRQIEIREDELQ